MKFSFDTKDKEEAFMKTRVESLGLPGAVKQSLLDRNVLTVRGLIQQTDDQIEQISGSFENSVTVIDSLDRLAMEVQLSEPKTSEENKSSDGPGISLAADDDIIATFAGHFGIDKETIEGGSRKQEIVKVRDLIVYVLREYADMSFPAIGRLLGGRDHTTIIHAYRKTQEKFKTESKAHIILDDLISKAKAIKERKLHIEEKLIPDLIASIREKQNRAEIFLKPKEIPDRNIKVLDLYRQGLTLENIGKVFKVSRERIRQIVEKTIRQIAFNESLSKGIELDADILLEEEKKMRGTAKGKEKEKTKPVQERRWSRYYMACKSCGTSSLPHVRGGLCEKCVGQYRNTRREEIIARHSNKCDDCGTSREDAIKECGRDFYITKAQDVYCKKCFLNKSGKLLASSRWDKQ